jgi:GNAT superfamily N-acetyltransferase
MYTLKSPDNEKEWRSYHDIRRQVLFESRGLFGIYDANRPDEFRDGHYPMVLMHRDEPIGVIRVDIEGRVAIFRRVAVREDSQRRGHGRTMLSLAEAFVREKGGERIRSFVDPGAVGFYEKCGFTHDQAIEDDMKAVAMSKELV